MELDKYKIRQKLYIPGCCLFVFCISLCSPSWTPCICFLLFFSLFNNTLFIYQKKKKKLYIHHPVPLEVHTMFFLNPFSLLFKFLFVSTRHKFVLVCTEVVILASTAAPRVRRVVNSWYQMVSLHIRHSQHIMWWIVTKIVPFFFFFFS